MLKGISIEAGRNPRARVASIALTLGGVVEHGLFAYLFVRYHTSYPHCAAGGGTLPHLLVMALLPAET